MESLPTDNDLSDGLERAIEEFASALARTEANRLADRVSEQFLKELSRELSSERHVELLLKTLVICLRSYAERGLIEPKLESLLQDWWGNAAFRELGQALQLFALAAERRGAERERRKIRVALPLLLERRLPQEDRQFVVVCKREWILVRAVGSVTGLFRAVASKVVDGWRS